MRYILFLSFVFASIISSSFAVDRIYTIGYTTAIMADDTEWTCNVKSDQNYLVYYSQSGKKYIQGVSKYFPLTFLFYEAVNFHDITSIEGFLRNYAVNTNTLLTNVTKQTLNASSGSWAEYIVECEYYNEKSSGHIQFKSKVIDGVRFVIVIKTDSKLLDKQTRESLYNSVNDLITPLYNPKALSLWLEAVERSESEQ